MPTVRYSGDGRYRVAGETYEPGDEADVSEGLATHLVDDVGSFEHVDADSGAAASPEPDTGQEDADSDDGDAEYCDAIKSDGEECGRELPCPYHSDEDDEEA